MVGRRLAGFFATLSCVGVAAAAPACDDDPVPECEATYRHALALGRRSDDPALARRFVTACAESFDPERLECIRAATTTGEALACRPVRKRPS